MGFTGFALYLLMTSDGFEVLYDLAIHRQKSATRFLDRQNRLLPTVCRAPTRVPVFLLPSFLA